MSRPNAQSVKYAQSEKPSNGGRFANRPFFQFFTRELALARYAEEQAEQKKRDDVAASGIAPIRKGLR